MGQTAVVPNKAETVYSFIVSYKASHDGLSPKSDLIAAQTGQRLGDVLKILDLLEQQGRIKGAAHGLVIPGGRWIAPGDDDFPVFNRLAGEFTSNAYRPAATDPDGDDPNIIPEDYTPPATLLEAQLEARRFWTASRMHLGRIEELEKQLDRYRQRRQPAEPAGRMIRRLELRCEQLEAENERLKADLRTANNAWRRYHNDWRASRELFSYSTWAARQLAALASHVHYPLAVGLLQ